MEGSSRRRYVLCACAAAGAAGYVWLKLGIKQQASGKAATDFDAFLVAPASTPAHTSQPATSFEAFLKVQPAQPSPTDFASFLIDAGVGSSSGAAGLQAQGQAADAAAVVEPIPEDVVPVAVLYGTEYGFAREVAEKLSQALKDTGKFWPLLDNAAHHPSGFDFAKHQAALLVFSTQGDGVPPTEARDFCDWLTRGPGAAQARPHLAFSVCALGDSSYTHFCACGRALDAALAASGAAPLAPRADIDKEDWPAVDAWVAGVLASLAARLPQLSTFADLGGVEGSGLVGGAAGGGGAGSGVPPPASGYSKARPYYARVVGVEGLCVLSGPGDKDTVKLELALDPGALGQGGLGYTPGDALGIWPTNPPQAVSALLEVLGATGDEVVPTPSWHYREQQEDEEGGDAVAAAAAAAAAPGGAPGTMTLRHALSVCYDIKTPKVRQLLTLLQHQHMEAAGGTDGGAAAAAAGPAAAAAVGGKQQVVRASIDLSADATAAAAGAGAEPAANGTDGVAAKQQQQQQPSSPLQQLSALLASDGPALEAWLAPRHVVDILDQLLPPPPPSPSPCGGGNSNSNSAVQKAVQQSQRLAPLEALLGVLRPLAPRLYSISSSPLEYDPPGSGVAATIAVVEYSSLGVERQGVASTQVARRLQPGRRLPVFMHRNPDFRLPPHPATPIIMVGPGTGLAPFRAFIQQRLLEAQQQQQQDEGQQDEGQEAAAAGAAGGGAMHLFFGCRRADQDFLYGPQLTAWHEAGAITLHTAFSRQGPAKVYVQQRLREAAAEMWRLLQAGGHFYVCGDAGSMAGAVEVALLDIIAQHLQQQQRPAAAAAADSNGSSNAAAAYLEQLSSSGRYQRDVWFS